MNSIVQHLFVKLFFTLCLISPFATVAQEKSFKKNDKLIISFGSGYFQEDLNWSIAGENSQGNDINILSELKWTNLSGPLFTAGIKWNAWKSFVVEGNFSQSYITSGEATDTDYNESDRGGTPTFYMALDSDRGSVTDLNVTIGYRFFKNGRFNLTPSIGYGLNKQSLYLLDHSNSNQNLNTTYKPKWLGWIVGVEGRFDLSERFSLELLVKYHQLKYTSEANWNLIMEFEHPVSFRHTANGFCINPELKVRYAIHKSWSTFIHGTYSFWDTGKGVDKLYLASGDVAYTQMNGVKSVSYGINIGLSKSFNW